MTKISFDVDFSKNPEEILKEIQERAKAEVEKRESKERNASYLSKLHESVNEKIGTDFNSVSDLIRALTPYAAPSLRDKLSGTTVSGRRKTISMNRDIFHEIKKLLTESDPNKAAIARQTGVSVVQVRKVADGGFDSKYSKSGSDQPSEPADVPSLPKFSSPPPVIEDESKDEPIKEEKITLPSIPSFGEEESKTEELPSTFEDSDEDSTEDDTTPSLPSFGGEDLPSLPPTAPLDISPTPAPDLPPPVPASEDSQESVESSDILPPLPQFTPAPFDSTEDDNDNTEEKAPPPLPSFGDEEDEEQSLPPPAPLDIAPAPSLPPPIPMSDEPEESEDSDGLLPPLPKFTPAPFDSTEDETAPSEEVTPPSLPSFVDDDGPSLPPAPLDIAPPPAPNLPPPTPASEDTQESDGSEEQPVVPSPPSPSDAPLKPPSPPSMSANPPSGGLTRPHSGLKPTLKPKLGMGKKGKPSLSLKPKSKTAGLKITRPPMRGNPPPSQ